MENDTAFANLYYCYKTTPILTFQINKVSEYQLEMFQRRTGFFLFDTTFLRADNELRLFINIFSLFICCLESTYFFLSYNLIFYCYKIKLIYNLPNNLQILLKSISLFHYVIIPEIHEIMTAHKLSYYKHKFIKYITSTSFPRNVFLMLIDIDFMLVALRLTTVPR